MKTFLTALLLCIFHFNCTAQWVELNVGNTTATYFSDVYAITPDIVVVVGDNGTILKTTDGGITWQQKNSGTTKLLKKIRFSNSNVGYIIGDQGTLLKTIDGGESWDSVDTGRTVNFEGLSPVGENLVYVAYDDNLLKSENGGITWQSYPIDFFYGDVQFLTQEIGYATKSDGGMLKTVNGGETWQGLESFARFHFISDKIGFCYMDGLKKTIDGGNNFVQLGYGNNSFLKIFAINENTVWGVITPLLNGDGTSPGTVKMTYDTQNGYSESFEYDDSNTDMSSIYFSNDKLGYAVGWKNGKATIWKNTTGNTLNVNEKEKINDIKVFPNPASDKINIVVNNQFPKDFTIILSDISGKKVYHQNFSDKKEVSINAQNFSKGTYILTVKNKKQTYSQKLIIQ